MFSQFNSSREWLKRALPKHRFEFRTLTGSMTRKQPTDALKVVEEPVVPVAYQLIFEPGIGQFREFESPRVHTRQKSWGLFLTHKSSCEKRESVR